MTKEEMIEEFICPGCVCGSDMNCGKYKPDLGKPYGACVEHVVGTFKAGAGNFALGLPKGFNRTSWCHTDNRSHSKMEIRVWPEDLIEKVKDYLWNNLNLPIWYMRKDNILFVRTYSPRIDKGAVDVLETDMCLNSFTAFRALNVANFIDEID